MITLRKLQSLPPGTRQRKILALFAELRVGLKAGAIPSPEEGAFFRAILALADVPDLDALGGGESTWTLRAATRVYQRLETHLGLAAAEWDLLAPGDRRSEANRFPLAVWLEDLRSPFNVGSVLRTAEAYGFESVFLSPDCPAANHPRVSRSAMGSAEHLHLATKDLSQLKMEFADLPVFALELGGTPVGSFDFPERGLLLLGSEELGLSPEALAWADGKNGRVTLPLYGQKASLNVGVAFGVAASAWTAALTAAPHLKS